MDIFQLVTFEHLDYQDLQQLFQYHFFIIFCFLFFLLKTFESVEYGVPTNCSICNVNANFEFIFLFSLAICKLFWYHKEIIMADWVIPKKLYGEPL